jgi:hypothetical protein
MQKIKLAIHLFIFGILVIFAVSNCGDNPSKDKQDSNTSEKLVSNPSSHFQADSAYHFIQKQIDFGYRIPGTKEHLACAQWLKQTLKGYVDTLYYQKGSAVAPGNLTIPVYNIIGSINPKATKRIMLASHWDSRPWADQDDKDTEKPILGANDGASGVGILMELARILKSNPLPNDIGIDIFFFDSEDYGKTDVDDSYCLGSQYWGKNLHIPNYKAHFGVLLDMVGGANAKFMWEGNSNEWGSFALSHIWTVAQELGYSSYFLTELTGAVIDDHMYVHAATKIPMIDIIHYDDEVGFAPHWHTHKDNMTNIDKKTLKAVGHTLENVLFYPPASIHY